MEAQRNFPGLSLVTNLEISNRSLSLSEAFAVAGISAAHLQEILVKTVWIAGLLRYWLNRIGLELVEGQLKWAISAEGHCFLVDSIGPDDLRIQKAGVLFSKDFLQGYYRDSTWYEALKKARSRMQSQRTFDWKRLVGEQPPLLSARVREAAAQLYWSLANEMTERKWFFDTWSLDQVTQELNELKGSSCVC
jgi:phosphoribosylaminoimidazole-succinocarboxamide synthase